jgi:hypothetical protein
VALRRSRIQLVLIFALFLVPPVGAWVAWQYLGAHGVDGTTNTGVLVSPARPLAVDGLRAGDGGAVDPDLLRGHWTYVVFAPDGCEATCADQLYLTRQVRLAMNKDIPRVQRVLVLDAALPPDRAQQFAADHADLVRVVASGAAPAFADQFRGAGFAADGAQYFLVDPLGNLMMVYDLSMPTKGMMKDLRKLLKISQIG